MIDRFWFAGAAMALASPIAPAHAEGASAPPVTIAVDRTLLAGLFVAQATLDLHGEHHICNGPMLSDVLKRSGAPTGEALRGAALRKGVLVVGSDGYAVLFSLAELDPSLGARTFILADRCDDKPLPAADGAVRLVVEGDKRPARSVRQVVRIGWVTG